MVVDRKKETECTSSAIFGVGTAGKCCQLKRCRPTEFGAEHNKDEVLEGKFSNMNFSPSTKKATEYCSDLFSSIGYHTYIPAYIHILFVEAGWFEAT